MNRIAAGLLAVWMPCLASAADDERMLEVLGAELHYQGAQTVAGAKAEAVSDAVAIAELVRANPAITTLVLSGPFPLAGDAFDVARMVEDMGLATKVDGECSDACVYIFVAGSKRELPAGAKIGVHRRTLSADHLAESFEAGQAKYGWKDAHAQAALMYDRGQSDMRWAVEWLMDHGVSLDFALKIFATPREDMWWPKRGELVEGGVISN